MKEIKQIIKICPVCGNHSSVSITVNEFERWQSGMNIQDAMPMQPASVREILLSGMCFTCQNLIFGSDE